LLWELARGSVHVRREGNRYFANEIAAGSEEPTSNQIGA